MDLIESFFDAHSVVGHHLESYDWFLLHGIELAVSEEPKVTVVLKTGATLTLDIGDVEVGKVDERGATPSQCRGNDMTYEAPVLVTVTARLVGR